VREFLLHKKITFTVRDFFSDPFGQAELCKLLKGKSPKEILSVRSPSIKSLGLDLATISDESLIEIMIKEPRLLRRPIVIINGVIVAGANEKTLLGLLD
jgi:regulatory protein spx